MCKPGEEGGSYGILVMSHLGSKGPGIIGHSSNLLRPLLSRRGSARSLIMAMLLVEILQSVS